MSAGPPHNVNNVKNVTTSPNPTLLLERRDIMQSHDDLIDELGHRSIKAPPGPLIPWCPTCPLTSFVVTWQEDRRGGRRIRAECLRCGRWLTWLPQAPLWTQQADRNASPTALLDVLTRLEDLGIDLQSDGRTVWVPWPDVQRIPLDLRAVIRQCSHQLARLLGQTPRRAR